MKRYWWIVLILVFALAVPALASGTIKIFVDGQELKSDVPAQVIDGSTMVPLRAIAEYLKKDVQWDGASQTVTITGMTDVNKVTAISAQWVASGHADTSAEVLGHAGTRNGCQPCHSGNGLERFLSDNKFLPEVVAEGEEHGEMPRPQDCATCHAGLGQELIDTGVAKAALVPFSDQDFAAPGSALCISCHNGRRNTKDMYQKWASGTAKPVDYPHHDAGALFSGFGGMEYPDVTYLSSSAHKTVGCVGCHMPETEDGLVSHEFNMNVKYINQTCGSCHKGATDYNMGGSLKAEIGALLQELHDAAVAATPGAVAIGNNRTIFPFVDKDGKRLDVNNVSTEAFVAAYNYYMLKDDLDNYSGGAHNPQYAKSLIRESLKKLKK